MLLKGFRQKRIRVCAIIKGANFDLQSTIKGHKNNNNKKSFCPSKGQDFEPWAAHTDYFLTPVLPGCKLAAQQTSTVKLPAFFLEILNRRAGSKG